jgi:hypothetical protein
MLIDSPDTSSNDLEADTLTLPLPSDDEPSSSTNAPALPTRTLSLPDTSTVDATPVTSPKLSIDNALADTVTPAPNVAEPDAPSTLTLPPAVREPSPPTKPDAEPPTLPDNDDAPTSIEPLTKPLSRPSDVTDIDPPTTSTSEELDKLALPPATTSRSPAIPIRIDDPVDTSIDSPDRRRKPEPDETDTSSSPATDTVFPPTLTPAEDDTETSPSAAKPKEPVSKPNELPVPPDTCRDSDATKDTRPLTRLALSPAKARRSPPADTLTSSLDTDTDSPEYTDRRSPLRNSTSDAVASTDADSSTTADTAVNDDEPPDDAEMDPALDKVAELPVTDTAPPLTTSRP